MIVCALDLATKTGFAIGATGTVPRSGVVRLKKGADDLDTAPRNLGCWLRDQFVLELPDLIAIEAPLPFFAKHNDEGEERQRSYESLVLPPMLVGAVLGIAGPYGIACVRYQANTVRKSFTGKASWGNRQATKQAVIRQAQVEKLIPADCFDDNRADAVSIWLVASMRNGRRGPADLALFGERARQ